MRKCFIVILKIDLDVIQLADRILRRDRRGKGSESNQSPARVARVCRPVRRAAAVTSVIGLVLTGFPAHGGK